MKITGCASFNPSTIAEKEDSRQNAVFLALPYLHTANVNGQHSSEEKHLQKEVRHQADHSEEAELLQTEHTD